MNTVGPVRGPCRIVLTHDAPEPASAVRDDDGGWTMTYRPDATVEQVQAALDSIGAGYTVTRLGPPEWEAKPSQRKPGPQPRQETNAERNRRWRRVQR